MRFSTPLFFPPPPWRPLTKLSGEGRGGLCYVAPNFGVVKTVVFQNGVFAHQSMCVVDSELSLQFSRPSLPSSSGKPSFECHCGAFHVQRLLPQPPSLKSSLGWRCSSLVAFLRAEGHPHQKRVFLTKNGENQPNLIGACFYKVLDLHQRKWRKTTKMTKTPRPLGCALLWPTEPDGELSGPRVGWSQTQALAFCSFQSPCIKGLGLRGVTCVTLGRVSRSEPRKNLAGHQSIIAWFSDNGVFATPTIGAFFFYQRVPH